MVAFAVSSPDWNKYNAPPVVEGLKLTYLGTQVIETLALGFSLTKVATPRSMVFN